MRSGIFCLLLQSIIVTSAFPILSDDSALTLDTVNNTLLDYDITTDFLHLTTTNNLTAPNFEQWRILNTPTSLRIALRPNNPIAKRPLGTTLLTTQQNLRTYISTHYRAAETALSPSDDPYKSSPLQVGCFVGVSSHPSGNKHLTYGVVANVLQGLWDYLYKGGREREAVFEVLDDVWGTVGVGRVTRERPDDGGRGGEVM